jgi:hypothetical protein
MRERVTAIRRKLDTIAIAISPDERWRVKEALEDLEKLNRLIVTGSFRDALSERDCRWWLEWQKGKPVSAVKKKFDRESGWEYTHEHYRTTLHRTDARLRAGDRPLDERLSAKLDKVLAQLQPPMDA